MVRSALTVPSDSANRSSTAKKDIQTISISNTSEIVFDENTPYSTSSFTISKQYRRNITYSQDMNFSIGPVNIPVGLVFRSHETGNSYIQRSAEDGLEESRNPSSIGYLWHSVGLGLRAADALQFYAAQTGASSEGPSGNGSVVIDHLRYGAGAIRSSAYSIWREGREARSPGRLLLGGLDESAYVAPLNNVPTTIVNMTNIPDWKSPGLAVNSTFLSIKALGQESVALDFPSQQTMLGPGNGIWLPYTLGRRMFDLLGANLTVIGNFEKYNLTERYKVTVSRPIVPCSYLTNTTTLEFGFTGTNLTVFVLISDLTVKLPDTVDGADSCYLTISASQYDDGIVALGEDMLKSLYRVYDLQNQVISLALTDFAANRTRSIKPIPAEGGVAAMGLSVSAGGSGNGSGSGAGGGGGAAGNNSGSGAMSLSMGSGHSAAFASFGALAVLMFWL